MSGRDFRLERRNVILGAAAFTALLGITNLQAKSRSTSMNFDSTTDALAPFRISVPQTALDDLRHRLQLTRWPEEATASDWSQGVSLEQMRALVTHWHDHYNWRDFEKRVNRWPQFRTRIDGLGFHLLHIRSSHADALPILLTHGWPGSFVEFLDTIEPLTEPTLHGGRPEDAFHVVIPSLPGFGFTDKPAERGWNAARVASAWIILMQRLGYDRWVAQGGDWGSRITHVLAKMRPPGLLAAHVNWPYVFPASRPEQPTPAEARAYADLQTFVDEGSGYSKQQQTRPQTLGYALTDSPAGQAAWIYEKIDAWSDHRDTPGGGLQLNAILDDISLYWLTASAASSARFYFENRPAAGPAYSMGRIDLPMAASIFPKEIFRPPHAWAQAAWPNLIYWNEVERGGHFAAFEQPRIFVEELRNAFRTVRVS